jgi:hypothetical protein
VTIVIRKVPVDGMPETEHDADPLRDQAAELFAQQLAEDRVPLVCANRAQLHVRQSWARRLRGYFVTGVACKAAESPTR